MNAAVIAEELKKDANVLAIILFGSHAKNKAKPLSDMDIAVVLDPYNRKSAAEAEANSSRNIDIVVFNDLPPYMQYEVMKYGKVLYCGDEERMKEHFLRAIRDYHYHIPLYRKFTMVGK